MRFAGHAHRSPARASASSVRERTLRAVTYVLSSVVTYVLSPYTSGPPDNAGHAATTSRTVNRREHRVRRVLVCRNRRERRVRRVLMCRNRRERRGAEFFPSSPRTFAELLRRSGGPS